MNPNTIEDCSERNKPLKPTGKEFWKVMISARKTITGISLFTKGKFTVIIAKIVTKLHFLYNLFRQNLQMDAYNNTECYESKTTTSRANLATEDLIPKVINRKSTATVENSPSIIKDTSMKLSEEVGNDHKELIKRNYQQNPLKELQNLVKNSKLHEIAVSIHDLYHFKN